VVTRDERLQLAFVGMHPDRRRHLSDRFGVSGTLQRILDGRIPVPKHARAAARMAASDHRRRLTSLGIRVVWREEFPPHLAELPDAPDVLFARGELPSTPGVGIVGTRRATSYGLRLAERYGEALAAAGWPVISGLARGIDGAGHRGALRSGGVTTAVMGSGVDVWYPRRHRDLGEEILASGGSIVSEYPPGTPPSGWRFPPRNRIISGLSKAVVVVEARTDGGALITARRALEQGRDVLAVPGDIDRPSSEGCNLLIRDGAVPVLGPQDLVEAVSLVLGPPVGPTPYRAVERGGLVALLGEVGRTLDELALASGHSVTDVMVEVARLEAEGLVERRSGLVVALGR
jgi:DNA processing protein